MLNNEQYVEQKLIIDLFYLRTMRRFASNLVLAFLPKDKEYNLLVESFAARGAELENELLQHSNNNIPDKALNAGIFTTQYTTALEDQTIKLMSIPIRVNITEKVKSIIPGKPTNPSQELINTLDNINKKALALAKDFLEFLKNLYNKETTKQQFTYAGPFLINYMIKEIGLYIDILNRLMNRQNVDPSFVSNYEYTSNQTMRDIAILIRTYVAPSREDFFIKAQSFVKEYDALLTKYKQSNLNPSIQENLTKQSETLASRLATFIEDVTKDLLDSKAYFTMEPTFLDNMLTEINYFKYNLKLGEKEEVSQRKYI